MLEIWWFFRESLDHTRLRGHTQWRVELLIQGGSKQVTYKHSGCKIQAIKLSYCKIQDWSDWKDVKLLNLQYCYRLQDCKLTIYHLDWLKDVNLHDCKHMLLSLVARKGPADICQYQSGASFAPRFAPWIKKLIQDVARRTISYMLNHGSLFCSNIRPIFCNLHRSTSIYVNWPCHVRRFM